jgi:hypothetical protein
MQGMDAKTRRRCTEWDRLAAKIASCDDAARSDPHHKVHEWIRKTTELRRRIELAIHAA